MSAPGMLAAANSKQRRKGPPEMDDAFIEEMQSAYQRALERGVSAIDAADCASKFADHLDDLAAADVWGLSADEQRQQAAQCPCRGSDENCTCQNSPSRRTLRARTI